MVGRVERGGGRTKVRGLWSLIRENRRRSILLLFTLWVGLGLLGALTGMAWFGRPGVWLGAGAASLLWLVLIFLARRQGASMILRMSGARPVEAEHQPQLLNVVAEMALAAALSEPPQTYILEDDAPNAFAIDAGSEKTCLVVTSGLLEILDRDELQGVVAHEVGHILNDDVRLMTLAGTLLGGIVLVADVFLQSVLHGRRIGRRISSPLVSRGWWTLLPVPLALICSLLTPIVARFIYVLLRKEREYLADATAVRLTRYPAGLASALEKIAASTVPAVLANSVVAPMFIVQPVGMSSLGNLGGDTHPPVRDRIVILRSLDRSVGLRSYRKAFQKVVRKAATFFAADDLAQAEDYAPREPSTENAFPGYASGGGRRGLRDLLRAVNAHAFLPCVCGLTVKVPPVARHAILACPRCGRELAVPQALRVEEAETGVPEQAAPRQVYHRVGAGWESVVCTCGNLMQLSPAFRGRLVQCKKCGAATSVLPATPDPNEAVPPERA